MQYKIPFQKKLKVGYSQYILQIRTGSKRLLFIPKVEAFGKNFKGMKMED